MEAKLTVSNSSLCCHICESVEAVIQTADGFYTCPECRFKCDKCFDIFSKANKYHPRDEYKIVIDSNEKRDFINKQYCYGCCCVCRNPNCNEENEYPPIIDDNWKCIECQE